jgi:hypothetical protein
MDKPKKVKSGFMLLGALLIFPPSIIQVHLPPDVNAGERMKKSKNV